LFSSSMLHTYGGSSSSSRSSSSPEGTWLR
jgi:hypothetical protein